METQKRSRTVCSGYDGEDILEEILKRLPAKTLGRFLSVSKPWKALISSPFFINLQSATENQIDQPYLNLLHRTGSLSLSLPHHSLHFPFRSRFNCVGVARGVVCIITRPENSVVLWNPMVRKYVTLPPFPQWYPRGLAIPRMMGFGYDEANKVFKVVRLSLGFSTYQVYSYVNTPRAEWRARKNETLGLWKGTGLCKGLELMHDAAGFGFYLAGNGTINWIFGSEVMAFDCESEELRTMVLPGKRRSYHGFRLMEYGGKLSLMVADACGLVRVWAMEVYGNGDSWRLMISTTNHFQPQPYGLFVTARLNKELLGVYLYQETMFLIDDDEAKSYLCGSPTTLLASLSTPTHPYSYFSLGPPLTPLKSN